MRRRPGQLQASPCIIRDELLQIACCRSGVASPRPRRAVSKSSDSFMRAVTSFVLAAFSTSSKMPSPEASWRRGAWDRRCVCCGLSSGGLALAAWPLIFRLDSVGPDRAPALLLFHPRALLCTPFCFASSAIAALDTPSGLQESGEWPSTHGQTSRGPPPSSAPHSCHHRRLASFCGQLLWPRSVPPSPSPT